MLAVACVALVGIGLGNFRDVHGAHQILYLLRAHRDAHQRPDFENGATGNGAQATGNGHVPPSSNPDSRHDPYSPRRARANRPLTACERRITALEGVEGPRSRRAETRMNWCAPARLPD